jgi:hypothetical protein
VPSLLRHPVARFVCLTALAGSLADWVLFATLVATVDTLVGGGPWATALVLLVRIVPGVLLAPVAARRVDGADLPRLLARHELVRLGAIATLAAAFATRTAPAVLAGLLALEFAAAMRAAARESLTSRHVPARTFTALNTATAVIAYGLLPVGPVLVAWLGTGVGWTMAAGGALGLTAAYRRLDPGPASAAVGAEPVATSDAPVLPGTGWRRVTVAAALGVLPTVALFALGPSLAGAWLGDRAATGPLYAAALVGGGVGFALANLRRLRADVAMVVATVGLGTAAAGVWLPGLVLLGIGAGAAYLDLQTRLQHTAADPSQFAAAFAVLKGASAVGVAGAPLLAAAGSLEAVLLAGAAIATIGAVVATPTSITVFRRALRTVLRVAARAVLRVEVVARDRRVAGPGRGGGPAGRRRAAPRGPPPGPPRGPAGHLGRGRGRDDAARGPGGHRPGRATTARLRGGSDAPARRRPRVAGAGGRGAHGGTAAAPSFRGGADGPPRRRAGAAPGHHVG